MILTMIPHPEVSDLTCHCALFVTEKSAELTVALTGALNAVDFSGSTSEELWRGTCAELFIRNPDDSSYTEINCAPDGRCTVSSFESYRSGQKPTDLGSPISIHMEKTENRARLKISFPGLILEGKECAVGVITLDSEGNRRFWGIDHWDGKPDFHRAENYFLIES